MTKNRKGFTLIELVIVIAIIGVLGAIIIPSALNYIRKANRKADITTARMIGDTVMAILAENDSARNSFYQLYTTSGSYNNGYACGSVADIKVRPTNEPSYWVRAVTSIDGSRACSSGGSGKKFRAGQSEVRKFTDVLNANITDTVGGNKKYLLPMKSSQHKDIDGVVRKTDRWFVVYRIDGDGKRKYSDTWDNVEVWAASSWDSAQGRSWGNRLQFRLWPAPDELY